MVLNKQDIKSSEGIRFRSFAKSREFGQDLYAGFVAPTLRTSLNVEAWRHGKNLPSNCSAISK